MKYIEYFDDSKINENFKNSFIVSAIAMTLLSSCSVLHHKKHKEEIVVKDKEELSEIDNANIPALPKGNIISNYFEQNKGKLPWPVLKGKITNKFGYYNMGKVTLNNNGVDIITNENTKIYSVFTGVVSKVFDVCGEPCIIITHDEHYYTVYTGFKIVKVKQGEKVNARTMLGISKKNINFQVWYKSKKVSKPMAVDPLKFVSK